MTHIKNIPHILKYGITHKNSPNANPYYEEIGDISLISTSVTYCLLLKNVIMIKYVEGDILESDAQALVNTVNTVGVMGKGIALQFKKHFLIILKPIMMLVKTEK